jgi:hypothetical protein
MKAGNVGKQFQIAAPRSGSDPSADPSAARVNSLFNFRQIRFHIGSERGMFGEFPEVSHGPRKLRVDAGKAAFAAVAGGLDEARIERVRRILERGPRINHQVPCFSARHWARAEG